MRGAYCENRNKFPFIIFSVNISEFIRVLLLTLYNKAHGRIGAYLSFFAYSTTEKAPLIICLHTHTHTHKYNNNNNNNITHTHTHCHFMYANGTNKLARMRNAHSTYTRFVFDSNHQQSCIKLPC